MAISKSLGDEHDVTLPQGTLRYRESGEGAPTIFVHGALLNADLWRKVVPELSDSCRCICPDLPLGAHASALRADADLSPPGIADLVRDFLDALKIDRATFVANDTGGALTQIFAARHPERVERLILTNCDSYEEFPPTRALRALVKLTRLPGAGRMLVWDIAQLQRSRRAQRAVFRPFVVDMSDLSDEILESYAVPTQRSRAVRRDTVKVLAGLDNRYTLAAAETLRSFDRPVLLAWGAADRFFTIAQAERLAAGLPNAELVRIEGVKTFVPEDRPAELAELIRERIGQAAVASG